MRFYLNANYILKMTKQQIFAIITTTRKEKGISQLKLSEMIGIDEATLIRNLKGETEMQLSTLLKICEVLELQIEIKPL